MVVTKPSVTHLPVVRSVLVIDVSAAVREYGYLHGSDVWAALPESVPSGALIELRIGAASSFTGPLEDVACFLRPAAGISVEGSNPRGINAVRRALEAHLGRSA